MTRYPVPRIVRGGQTSGDSWAIYDRRTKELLAQGDTGLEEYDAAAERLDPEEGGSTTTISGTTCRSLTSKPQACPHRSRAPSKSGST
jgi:hypothetical protein